MLDLDDVRVFYRALGMEYDAPAVAEQLRQAHRGIPVPVWLVEHWAACAVEHLFLDGFPARSPASMARAWR